MEEREEAKERADENAVAPDIGTVAQVPGARRSVVRLLGVPEEEEEEEEEEETLLNLLPRAATLVDNVSGTLVIAGFSWSRQARDARHHGRYGPDGQLLARRRPWQWFVQGWFYWL